MWPMMIITKNQTIKAPPNKAGQGMLYLEFWYDFKI